MFDSASAALATAVMAAYLATGSSMSTRSIFQPCGTNTPNFVDRAMLSPPFANDRIADAKGRARDAHVRCSNSPLLLPPLGIPQHKVVSVEEPAHEEGALHSSYRRKIA